VILWAFFLTNLGFGHYLNEGVIWMHEGDRNLKKIFLLNGMADFLGGPRAKWHPITG
jgi:hypothetical protein